MRSLMIVTFGAWMAATMAFGAPACVTGSYTSYVALGAGGCLVGDATFNNFSGLGFVNSAGVPALTTDQIQIVPSGSLTNATLTFVYVSSPGGPPTPVTVSTTGAIFSFGFSYDLVVSPSNLSSVQMSSTFSNTAQGGVSSTKNAQLGGSTFTSQVSDNNTSNALATRPSRRRMSRRRSSIGPE